MKKQNDAKTALNILSLEDSQQDFELIRELLIDTGWDFKMDRVEKEQEFISALQKKKYNIILSDFKLPEYDAFKALRKTIEICPDIPFIVVSGTIGEETAIKLIKQGAIDYILKDKPTRLPSAIKRALEEAKEKILLKMSEEKLRESGERFRNAITYAPYPLMIHADGKVLQLSEEWIKQTGYTIDDIPTIKKWSLKAYGKDAVPSQEFIDNLYKIDKRQYDGERKVKIKDGSNRLWDFSSSPIGTLPNGKKIVISMAFDITERKHAEEELHTSRDLLSSVLENIPMRVFWKDIELHFLGCNSAFAKDAGMSHPEDLIGKDDFQMAWSEDAELYRADDKRVIDSNTPKLGYEEPQTTPDGHTVWLHSSKVPLRDAKGKVIGLLAIYDDITERKNAEKEHERLQNQLQQAQKMESVGRLAGGVAHDYNNISSVILGYSELALDKLEQSDPLYGDLMEILTAAKRSTDITRQLLAFARKQTIAPEVLDLNDSIGDLLKMLRRLIGEDIDLAWLPGIEVWPIKMDPSQINQIMANLCVNARDAIANVGRVTVETKNIKLDKDDCFDHDGAVPGEYIELSVSDDGCGMTPETRDNIFEPFFTTKGTKGTGLGLSTVYGIVKQNNGLINVYSEPEKGTTFKIYLPIYVGQIVKEHSEKEIELPLSRGETVLLVEDDESILKIVKRILEELGYAVLFSSSPMEAISLATEHADEINLLITDVVMPEMNGRELSERLQSLYPNLKTLFMSGYTADIIAKRGVLESGVNFIEKPFSNKDLAFKIREVMGDENEQE